MRQTFKHIIRKPIYLGIFILSIVGITIALASGFDMTLHGTFGTSQPLGSFSPTGNGGLIMITPGAEPCDPITGTGQLCYDSSTQTFSGWIFAETVGWIRFGVPGYPIKAILPTTINSLAPWTLTGFAWSDNAGWISLGCLGSCSYSGVYYVPNSTISFTGTAWSDTLGYIDLISGAADFTNKVKVIGGTAGGNAWSLNYDIGNTYDTAKLTPFLSQVRQNIAILTRNADISVINTSVSTIKELGKIRYYRLNGGTLIVNIGSLLTIDSIIVEGGDIEIIANVTKDTTRPPKSIIAIQNNGLGGNIFIKDNVKNIYSSLVAEGSVYSGEDATNIYNDTRGKISILPKNQLYIHGSLISHNTIGGAIRDTPKCPYTIITCAFDMAIRYDLNYFRSFDGQSIHESDLLGYLNYSTIIERDPRVITSPPPGMKTLK